MEKLFPVLIMAESFLAALIYIQIGRPGSAVYWMAAGFLNMAVIFIIPGEI